MDGGQWTVVGRDFGSTAASHPDAGYVPRVVFNSVYCLLSTVYRYTPPMRRFDALVLENREISRDYRRIVLEWPGEVGTPRPGAFLTVGVSGTTDPLLRRPFAFSGFDPLDGWASFIFQIRGPATRLLAERRPGTVLDVLGPLGNGFPDPAAGALPILAGGGIGLGPMLFTARDFQSRAAEGGWKAPVLVLGFRTAPQIPDIELPEGTAVCTDDGSSGFHGSAVQGVELAEAGSRYGTEAPPIYYACGPAPMLAALNRLAASRSAPYWAAVEQWMACGVGACMGCAVRLKDGSFARACVEGPVFEGSRIDWGAM